MCAQDTSCSAYDEHRIIYRQKWPCWWTYCCLPTEASNLLLSHMLYYCFTVIMESLIKLILASFLVSAFGQARTRGQCVESSEWLYETLKRATPNSSGYLNKLEFVSSIDNVYRDLRVFRASLANSSSIDDAYETMINIVYYILIIFLGLIILGEYFHVMCTWLFFSFLTNR